MYPASRTESGVTGLLGDIRTDDKQLLEAAKVANSCTYEKIGTAEKQCQRGIKAISRRN